MRLFFHFFILLVGVLVNSPQCLGQSYSFRHYQVDQGLAHNAIKSIVQDSRGFIWLGTKAGLNSFDGYTFKSYSNPNNINGTLGDNNILSICEDTNGRMWIGTGKGLFRYDPFMESIVQLPGFETKLISHILTDRDGILWFLANNRLYTYRSADQKLIRTDHEASCITLDEQNNLWMGDDKGAIRKLTIKNKFLFTAQILDRRLPINVKSISKILPIGKGKILIGTYKQGVLCFDALSGKISTLLTANQKNATITVRDIVRFRTDEYWISTEIGIFIYHFNTGEIVHVCKKTGDENTLSDNAVYALCKDDRQNMWVGTYFGGLNYYSQENARFKKYYPVFGRNSISGHVIRELSDDLKGNIWIGTEDAGISKLNTATGQFTHILPDTTKKSLSSTNIQGLRYFDGKLYIGSFMHGLEIMDASTLKIANRFKLVGDKNHSFSDFVMCIYTTRDKKLLMGSLGYSAGLLLFDPKTKTFKRIGNIPYNTSIFSILEDHSGTIWVGTIDQGTYYFNPKTNTRGHIMFRDKSNKLLDEEYLINGIFEDSRHELWFSTDGGGLIRLGANRKTIRKYTQKDGFPSNSVYRILEDSNKNLWISSLKGLIRYNLKTEKFKVYTKSNGLTTDQFNYNSALKTLDGSMYFGTVKGMISFNPDEFGQYSMVPPTYVTGLQINNQDVYPGKNSPLKKSILFTDSLVLQHHQASFAFEFSTLDYSSPEATRYKYRMLGLDDQWVYLNSNRKVYFTDLAPGVYTFILQSESNVGSWTGYERRLYITIRPPFWKSQLAYILYTLMVLLLGYFLVLSYKKRMDKKNNDKLKQFEDEKEKEIYKAKIEFFTNITHEIQTPLTLIAGPVEIIMKKIDRWPELKKSLYMIEKHTHRLIELTDQLLDFRKTEINQFELNFVNTDINSTLSELVGRFSLEAERSNIRLLFEASDVSFTAYIDKNAFVKICNNLISNAIKYAESEARVIVLPWNEPDEYFSIRFMNDGASIPKEYHKQIFEPFFRVPGTKKPGTGVGLSLANSLTSLHNGRLEVVDVVEKMTIFELSLPVHQKIEFNLKNWKSSQH